MDKLKALRELMAKEGLTALLIPRSDEFQGEFISDASDRLKWLTGFTGSAGFAVVTKDKAAFFTDSRYTIQAREQVPETYEHYNISKKNPSTWVSENLKSNDKVGYNPWFFTGTQLKSYDRLLVPLKRDLIDVIWTDKQQTTSNFIVPHPIEFAGESGESKRKRISEALDSDHVLITASDSIAWLLNIRGNDVPYNPIVQSYCLLHKDGSYDLFVDLSKVDGDSYNYITKGRGRAIDIAQVCTHLKLLTGDCQIDPSTTPVILVHALEESGVNVKREQDPCVLPKALKNEAEIQGAIDTHIQDGLALCRFFAWLSAQPLKGETTELSAALKLNSLRADGKHFKDLSFFPISAFGPHGAIIHYRVSPETDIPLKREGIYLVDSGGQYLTGTTDVTVTFSLGSPTEEQKDRYTRVLKGYIAIAQAIFPKGTSGQELDILARQYLWQVGLDYEHGTGHGVGSYLNVHEGPQGISRRYGAGVPLMPGMILSNEPGFYKEGEYGIRIESLIRVVELPDPKGFYGFETLTLVPLDRNLIELKLMTDPEKDWVNTYNARVLKVLGPHLDSETKAWLEKASQRI
jgi:Xaa-Pro aminopeptidase